MKVKEKYCNEFKNEDVLKQDEKYVVFEYDYEKNTPKLYRLKNKETGEIVFEFEVPNPFDSEDFEKDLCLRYGHGIRGFILSLFDKITKDVEISSPYLPNFESDIYFKTEKEGVSIFSVENPFYKLGFFKNKEYIDLFIDYFGFKTAIVI